MYRLSTFAISYHTGISISYRYESRVFVHFLIFFVCNLYLQVTEVFNYSQDDLLTEDMLVLDTHAEVFIWIGQSVDSKEKQKAFDIGQVFGVQGNSFQKKLLHLFGNAMHASEVCFYSAKTDGVGSELGASLGLSPEKEVTEGDGTISESTISDTEVAQDPEIVNNGGETTFSYERLKAKSSNPVRGIDYKRREVCQ
ncbi:hypothetical protein GW17_00000459 [Ensete ventricosum]|nr:hypothetical protein GW17_00000459 [Ensete ventricosum]